MDNIPRSGTRHIPTNRRDPVVNQDAPNPDSSILPATFTPLSQPVIFHSAPTASAVEQPQLTQIVSSDVNQLLELNLCDKTQLEKFRLGLLSIKDQTELERIKISIPYENYFLVAKDLSSQIETKDGLQWLSHFLAGMQRGDETGAPVYAQLVSAKDLADLQIINRPIAHEQNNSKTIARWAMLYKILRIVSPLLLGFTIAKVASDFSWNAYRTPVIEAVQDYLNNTMLVINGSQQWQELRSILSLANMGLSRELPSSIIQHLSAIQTGLATEYGGILPEFNVGDAWPVIGKFTWPFPEVAQTSDSPWPHMYITPNITNLASMINNFNSSPLVLMGMMTVSDLICLYAVCAYFGLISTVFWEGA